MRITEYSKLRSGVQMNARPGTPADVRSTALELQRSLLATGYFDDVEVDRTENLDHLVVAMCTFDPSLTEHEVARRLEDVWNGRLRYGFWAAHSMLLDEDQVELQGATLSSLGGRYVTLHIVAQKARVPAQRVGVE